MQRNLYTTIYLGLTLLCVGISMYLSYYGYYTNFQGLALPFTLVIGLGLFGSDLLIRQKRLNGQSLLQPLSLFFVFAFFSAISNFNYLYTNFMQQEVLESTLNEQYAVFAADLSRTRSTLLGLPQVRGLEDQSRELERELTLLEAQVSDPLRPGCGSRCQAHIQAIHEILGRPLTDLALPEVGATTAMVDTWYANFAATARIDLRRGTWTSDLDAINGLVRRIDSELSRFHGRMRDGGNERSLDLLTELSDVSRELERAARSIAGTGALVEHTVIIPTLGRLGEIVFSLHNGFVDRPNIGVTLLSALLGIIVDFFPVLFAMVIFGRDSGFTQRSDGGVRDRRVLGR